MLLLTGSRPQNLEPSSELPRFGRPRSGDTQARCVPGYSGCDPASAGASEHLKVAMVTNLVSAMKELKNADWIVGTDSRADISCYDMVYPGHIALVVGGEGKGIRRLVKENCDYMVSIPMRGRVNSLNASVSAAIVLAEIVRQRRAAAKDNG